MLDFLANVVISDQDEAVSSRKGGPRKQRNPEGLSIRLFRDGSVFPSEQLVAQFNLEYPSAELKERKPVGEPKEGEEQKFQNVFEVKGEAGNGFDVIDTATYPTFQVGKRIIIIAPVNRKEPKVDLFGSTTYNEDGTPKASVIDQGAKTFGLEVLVPMVEAVYGVKFRKKMEGSDTLSEGVDSVDLVLVGNPSDENKPWTLPAGKDVTFFPKRITRGEAKGQMSITRREKPQFYVLMPQEVAAGAPEAAEEVNENVNEEGRV